MQYNNVNRATEKAIPYANKNIGQIFELWEENERYSGGAASGDDDGETQRLRYIPLPHPKIIIIIIIP